MIKCFPDPPRCLPILMAAAKTLITPLGPSNLVHDCSPPPEPNDDIQSSTKPLTEANNTGIRCSRASLHRQWSTALTSPD